MTETTQALTTTEPVVTERMVSEFRRIANAIALEAAQDYAPVYVDPRESGWGHPQSNPLYTRPYTQSSPADRQDGRYLPVYDTEADLRVLRAMTRLMAETVPAAATIMERLCDYTVSSGYDYQILPSDGEKKNALSQRAVRIWEQFGRDNQWFAQGEREAFKLSHEEGEWLAWPEASGGSIELCDATTDEITEPAHKRDLEEHVAEKWGINPRGASWAFGVHRRTRGRLILGFHVVRDNIGVDWDYVPMERAAWIKRYTPSRANRGVSAFFRPHQYLQRADKVFRNTSDGTAIQAAIAYIVEHAAGVSGKQVEALTAGQALVGQLTSAYVRQRGGGTVPDNVSGISPGSVPHIKNGSKVHAGPLGSTQSSIYLDVMQAGLRLSGTLWALPEGMISGDWSNGNYSSTEIAEGPFMKGREADQVLTGEQFQKLVWAVLRVAFEQGQFRGVAGDWEHVRHGLDVTCQAPNVITRDMLQESQRYAIEHGAGIISRRTWQTKAGYDADAEDEQITAERGSVRAPMQGASTPGINGWGSAPASPQTDTVDQPKETPNDLSIATTSLNGAQITAAVDVLDKINLGTLSEGAAVSLLTAVGIPNATARQMIQSQRTAKPVSSKEATESSRAAVDCRQLSAVMERKASLEVATRVYP